MAKNDLTLLDSVLDEYIHNHIPSEKPDEVFEYFSVEQILKDYAFTKEELLQGSVDGHNDGGIDEFFILVNGHMAESILDDYWPRSCAELDVYIFTCKHDDSFKQAPITTMIPTLIELFDFNIPSSSLREYNEKILKKRETFISAYKRLIASLVTFNIHIIYSCRGNEKIESNIQAKADQARDICLESFSDCNASFEFWGNSKLLARYRERASNNSDLLFEECISQDGQYIVLASIKKYYEFLQDSKGNLNKHLFDSNVRDYLGLNPVNTDIQESLANSSSLNFWWLNNGITIIGTNAHIIGKTMTISDVQIVNGLQTSESIFNYFSGKVTGSPIESDSRSVLIKVLISSNKQINDKIIYATNNQTNVNVTALRATDKVQIDIEDILKSNHIYYERKTHYYQNLGIPASAIITPLSLAAGYISLIYKNPFVATSLKQKFMRDNRKYEKVFSSSTDLKVWVTIAKLLLNTDSYLTNLKEEIHGDLFRFHKYYRQMILFTTVSRLMGTFAFGEKSLIEFDVTTYTQDEVKKSIQDIHEYDSRTFISIKKPSLHFYSGLYIYISQKYNIKHIQAILEKNKLLWSNSDLFANYKLTDEIIELVSNRLPSQPWPANIHKTVAQELNLPEEIVSNTIGYLIYSKKFNHQVYGYVFDEQSNVIAESEHYNHTIEQARRRKNALDTYYYSKFGF